MPKPIEDECVRLDNSPGGYSTAANWITTIREAGILQLHIGPRTSLRRVAKVLNKCTKYKVNQYNINQINCIKIITHSSQDYTAVHKHAAICIGS